MISINEDFQESSLRCNNVSRAFQQLAECILSMHERNGESFNFSVFQEHPWTAASGVVIILVLRLAIIMKDIVTCKLMSSIFLKYGHMLKI